MMIVKEDLEALVIRKKGLRFSSATKIKAISKKKSS